MIWTTIISFLSKIKLKHILALIVLGLVGYSVWAFGEIKRQKDEVKRNAENFDQILNLTSEKDSLKTAFLQFKTTTELQDYIKKNQDLQYLLRKANINNKEVKKLKGLILQKTSYIDSLNKRMDVSGMVEKVRKDIPHIETWQTKSECSEITGNVTYQNDSLNVNVTSEKYNNSTLVTEQKKRKQWKFWFVKSRFLGKKYIERKTTTQCGDTQTVVVDKIE